MKIYIFGDSICVGQHVDVSETWPSLLSQWLKLEFKGMGRSHVCLSNRSINGNTTWDALGRIQPIMMGIPSMLVSFSRILFPSLHCSKE